MRNFAIAAAIGLVLTAGITAVVTIKTEQDLQEVGREIRARKLELRILDLEMEVLAIRRVTVDNCYRLDAQPLEVRVRDSRQTHPECHK